MVTSYILIKSSACVTIEFNHNHCVQLQHSDSDLDFKVWYFLAYALHSSWMPHCCVCVSVCDVSCSAPGEVCFMNVYRFSCAVLPADFRCSCSAGIVLGVFLGACFWIMNHLQTEDSRVCPLWKHTHTNLRFIFEHNLKIIKALWKMCVVQ